MKLNFADGLLSGYIVFRLHVFLFYGQCCNVGTNFRDSIASSDVTCRLKFSGLKIIAVTFEMLIIIQLLIPGKLSLDDLKRVYFSMKDTVFKRQSKLISHICDTKALEDLLKGTLGTEKTMDSVKTPKYKSTSLLLITPLILFFMHI